jgi:hypothetical protein
MSEPPAWQAPGSPPPAAAPASVPPTSWGAPTSWGPVPPAGYAAPPPAPPRPGVVPLRPLGLGEILDGAVQTMRHNPRVMFGLAAIVSGLAAVVSTLLLLVGMTRLLTVDLSSDTLDSADVAAAVSSGVVGFLVPATLQFLALSVLNGILIIAVSEAVIGHRPTVGEVLRRVGWAGAGRLMLLTLLTAAIGVLAVAVVAVPVVLLFLLAVPAGAVATVIALPLIAAIALTLTAKLAFAAPALLLEELGVGAALRRSWRLVVGSFWRVLGIMLLSAAIAWAASGLLQLPFSLLGQLVAVAVTGGADGSATLAFSVSTAIANLGSVLGAAVVAPFSAGVVSLLYIDLRIRREGLDVALARAAAAAPGPR